MPNKIERRSSVSSPYVLTASAGSTPLIPYGASSGGAIVVSAVSGGASSLTWCVAVGPEATPVPMASASTTSISAGNAYVVPDEVFAAPFITAKTNAGTATITLLVKG